MISSLFEHDLRANAFRVCWSTEKRFARFRIVLYELEFAHVGVVAVAVHRPALGAFLQFYRTLAVRLPIFLLVPVCLGADFFAFDLAGLSQPAPRRSLLDSGA